MKKRILLGLVLVVLTTVMYLGYRISVKTASRNEVNTQLATIPDFQFIGLNGDLFQNRDLKSDPVVFIYFNSECDYCQHEAQNIKKEINRLDNIQLLFISDEPLEAIREFSEHHELDKFSNILFLKDQDRKNAEIFGVTVIPYHLIYNRNDKLVKKHKGALTANGILNSLND